MGSLKLAVLAPVPSAMSARIIVAWAACLRAVAAGTADRQLAEDLVAEAFTRAWMSCGRSAGTPGGGEQNQRAEMRGRQHAVDERPRQYFPAT
jgi:DNA-directed RNA polymerase specialized sigma24 family protein